ncbi:MAG: diacylglycerol kinase [Opitutales bacterium]
MLQEKTQTTPFTGKSEGIRHVVQAFWHSFNGIASTLKHESAFRWEVTFAAVMIPLAILLPVGLLGKALMIGSIFMLLAVELLNSAVEWTIDLVSPNYHPYAKRAKDMASAAVMLSIVNLTFIWVLVVYFAWDRIAERFWG